jgi:Zn-dependent peptidase ImmA (M78 family)
MTRSEYYNGLRDLARRVRAEHGITTPRVLLSDMRRVYKAYGIKIDLWPHKLKNLRGAYFNDESGPWVMIARNLPDEQRIFTMAHELKHHLVDHTAGTDAEIKVQDDPKEIGAEVFAAEFIFPDLDFIEYMQDMGIGPGQCTAETVVRLKQETKTTLSYTGLAKKAEFLEFAAKGSLGKVKWKILEERMYGEPFYKALQRRRKAQG